MSEAGLTFPAPPASGIVQLNSHLIDEMSQGVVVARFVAKVVGRGQAYAEVEEAAFAIIELKNQEVSKLRDKLQYYETINHGMSQRKLVGCKTRHVDFEDIGESRCRDFEDIDYFKHT